MKLKQTFAAWTVLLLLFSAVVPVMAETTIQHPALKVYGDVTKPVYPGRSIFEYKDDQGLSSTLPFERQDENISISFSNIVFSKNFENKSIASATVSKSTELTVTNDLLSENGLEYIYLKVTNNSALAADTAYAAIWQLDVSDEPAITNDYYVLVTAKISKLEGANIASWELKVQFDFVDNGATSRAIKIYFKGVSGTDSVTADATSVGFFKYGADGKWITIQLKIQDLFDETGTSWVLSKLTGLTFHLKFTTGSTLDSSNTIEAKIRHVLVLPSRVYIDDPFYTNGLIVNGTSGDFTPQAGDVINVYGANCTKIVGVTIPWQVEVAPEIDADPDNLRMQYTWTFTMPKSPSEVGDTLIFSNTNITLIGYKDGDAWDKLYLNGVDKLSSIASKKVDETLGYWKYALATSLTEGNMYQVIARISYTAEEYDALTTEPLWWSNPFAWIAYKFWTLIIAAASFLGLSTAWALKQRRKYQVPKR